MELYELKEHCREQLKKLPRTSKMYEEHLLVLALIETNKKYFEELEEKKKQIELMAEMIDELSEYYTRYWGKNNEFCKEDCIKKDIDCKDCIKQYFENKAKENEDDKL